ncbi:MAG: LAGLIDADG family homing endonuclease [Candidatus Micrarchaeota archaeon]
MEVDLSSQIAVFTDFFTTIYKSKIDDLLAVYPTQKSLYVSYADLEKFDPDMADALIKSPDLIIEAAKDAIKQLNLSIATGAIFAPNIRFSEMPSENVWIEGIGSKDINELVAFKCVVTKRAEIMHRVKVAVYKCTLCDAEMKLFVSKNFVPPKRCESCKKFALQQAEEESTFTDIQRAEVQELLERIRGGAPAAHIELLMEDDLVNKIAPGDNIEVVGILRLKPPIKTRQKQEMIYSRYIEVNSSKSLKRDFEEIEISKDDERRLKELAKNPNINEILVKSIAPSIYGHNEVKKALTLQLFGGTRGKIMKGGLQIRDDIHILLIGDPGIAKSRFLQSVSEIAPKSIYVSGKSVSGAGLTVSAEKDELGEGGWTLKAGALVLASGGTAQVDEFDKIEEDDRAALHEAMETQSYHYRTKLMLADGKEIEIGKFVEDLMVKHREHLINGNDCIILREGISNTKILSTDFEKVYPTTPYQISKHKAPEYFIKVKLQTGRELMVTPEHPFWIVEDGIVKTKPANELDTDDYTLMPRTLPIIESKNNDDINRFKIVGYHITDGGYELNRGTKNGINFYNKDDDLIEDYQEAVESTFNKSAYIRTRPETGVTSVRVISMPVVHQITKIESNLMLKGNKKIIPQQYMSAPKESISTMLRAIFDSDGTFTHDYVGLVGENRTFIEQVQTLLLRFGIRSHIFVDGQLFRLTITGRENLQKYLTYIGFLSKRKKQRIIEYLKNSTVHRNTVDVIPNCINAVVKMLKIFKINENCLGYGLDSQKKGYAFTRRNFTRICDLIRSRIEQIKSETERINRYDYKKSINARMMLGFSQQDLAEVLGVSRATIGYWEKRLISEEKYKQGLRLLIESRLEREKEFTYLERFAIGEIGFVAVKDVEKIDNVDQQWAYDVTVQPSQSFISECTILHNTVSVAKAGIVAKFRTKTSILAAANPKYGRFDQTKNLADQFDVPPTLLSRFDLIFPIVDVLDEEKDTKLAEYILATHRGDSQEDGEEFDRELLRKYISYARRKISPKLTTPASQKIKDFYVELRRKSKDAGSVAITPRYLEGLVRLAEANAKMRLNDSVEEEDAEVAISLFNYVMAQIMTDKVTGTFDIDVVATGKPRSEREKLQKADTIMEIIKEHLRKHDTADVEQVISDAKSYDIDETNARRIIAELLRKGVVYEKEYGHIKIVGE